MSTSKQPDGQMIYYSGLDFDNSKVVKQIFDSPSISLSAGEKSKDAKVPFLCLLRSYKLLYRDNLYIQLLEELFCHVRNGLSARHSVAVKMTFCGSGSSVTP